MAGLQNKCVFVILLSYFMHFAATAQIPEHYYTKADGKSGADLKTALYHIIKNPEVISYSGLWKAFETTDARKNGKVWDMYSDNKETADYYFDFSTNRCGTYRKEGDCYNREHSVPKSWFKEAPPMHSDLFHIYPTDGYVNNKRGNLPFGEVGITSWTSTNGSKVGRNTFGNYTKTVFEPVDEYKGDFARTYFYMVTAYEENIPRWNSDQVGGTRYPGFSGWSLDLLLKWHREDPVSIKEVRRNEEVYKIQKNRNPYIDYPELVEYVWGKQKNSSFHIEESMSSHSRIAHSPFERWLEKICQSFKNRDI